MAREDVERALVVAIEAESQVGLGWSSWAAEMAPIAYRRWHSFERRHPKAEHPSAEERVLDLAKGLHAHIEPGVLRNDGQVGSLSCGGCLTTSFNRL